MKKYRVKVIFRYSDVVHVEAKDEKEAETKALDECDLQEECYEDCEITEEGD